MRKYVSNLAPLMCEYTSYMQASKKWSATYADSLSYFDRYCKDNYPEVKNLSQEMVNGWCAQRDSENNNSCISRINAIVSFVNYLRKRGLTDVNSPTIPRKETSTYIPHAFTEQELLNFFNACDSVPVMPNTKINTTRRLTLPVFFRLLYSSGLRTNEARLLRRTDVDFSNGVLNIEYTKGAVQHFVVLHDSMLKLMKQYDTAISSLYHDRVYFFPSIRGGYYTRQWVQENFRAMWYKFNTNYASAYELRHNYAIENINNWTDDGFGFNQKLHSLSKSMGHTEIESTKYYYSLTPRLADVMTAQTDENETIPEVHYESY